MSEHGKNPQPPRFTFHRPTKPMLPRGFTNRPPIIGAHESTQGIVMSDSTFVCVECATRFRAGITRDRRRGSNRSREELAAYFCLAAAPSSSAQRIRRYAPSPTIAGISGVPWVSIEVIAGDFVQVHMAEREDQPRLTAQSANSGPSRAAREGRCVHRSALRVEVHERPGVRSTTQAAHRYRIQYQVGCPVEGHCGTFGTQTAETRRTRPRSRISRFS